MASQPPIQAPPDESELTQAAFGPPPGGGLGDLAGYIAGTAQRGLNMASDYFTGKTLTDWAKQGIHYAYGLTPGEIGASLLQTALPSDQHADATAAAMRDEAEGLAAKLVTDPVALLLPASRAAALLFAPGAIHGAATGFKDAAEAYYNSGEQITPEVGRALVRGVANTAAAAAAGVSAGRPLSEGEAAFAKDLGQKMNPLKSGEEGSMTIGAPPAENISDLVEHPVVQKIQNSAPDSWTRRAKLRGADVQGLFDNIENGKPYFEGEPVGAGGKGAAGAGAEQYPWRRSFYDAYLNSRTGKGQPEAVFNDVPGVGAKMEQLQQEGASAPKYIANGHFNAVYDIGNVQGQPAILRVSAEKATPWPKSEHILQPIETHVTPEGIRMDVMPKANFEPLEKLMKQPGGGMKAERKLQTDKQTVKEALNKEGYDTADLHEQNIAYRNGKPVVIDPGAAIPKDLAGKANAFKASPEDQFRYFDYLARGVLPASILRGLSAPPSDSSE